ncbi:hypothetical protein A2415_02870 [candidate division WWE3 bacterium RIFOXYC1_FULL_39_7]|uniref:Uncharacterized protein n=2 Tax=Katanobacteria TaxID=422282 RepID=A0A1F4X606_UNCKA|nr:MAG: hypothetical protein A2415_02870 [candidate division WWE3 bacterium RIFOXYC1_FULL_39_7]OGC77125.1 MAG: hypothetical protein A2619_00395 [candidate division WWE3 bacterium RIFOXYD1_FULL_39_9]
MFSTKGKGISDVAIIAFVLIGLFTLFITFASIGYFFFKKVPSGSTVSDEIIKMFESMNETSTNTQKPVNTNNTTVKVQNTGKCENYYYLKRSDIYINKCFSSEEYVELVAYVEEYDRTREQLKNMEDYLNYFCNTETPEVDDCEFRAIDYRTMVGTVQSQRDYINSVSESK